MKPNLLNDVLTEGDYAAFREDLLRQIQNEARKKRFSRAARQFALAASVALVIGITLASKKSELPTSPPLALRPTVPILKTVPLHPSQILETHPNPTLVFTTDPLRKIPSISDNELLALFPNHPIGVASPHDGQKQFFFLNPADAKTYMSSTP